MTNSLGVGCGSPVGFRAVGALKRTPGVALPNWMAAICVGWVSTLGTGPAAAAVVGEVVSVGFPSVGASTSGGDLVRVGAWVPVIVDLTLEGQASFDGWIRAAQPDRDGDFAYDQQKVQLLAGSGESRRYFLYVLAGSSGDRAESFGVELFSSDNSRVDLRSGGQRVSRLSPRQVPEFVGPEEFVVLSVSSRTAGKLALLGTSEAPPDLAGWFHVAHIDPSQLPGRWQGLEMVDAVVWDDADTTEITGAQLEALVEWVRQGGMLVLAAGRTADTLVQSKVLGPLLPVDIGLVKPATAARRLRQRLLGLPSETEYRSPIDVVICGPRAGATEIIREEGPGLTTSMVTQTRVGRGRVTFVAATLRDIFSEEGNPYSFYKRLLELRVTRPNARYSSVNLFDEVAGWIGFRTISTIYLTVAVPLAAMYVFGATFGTWGFLRTRGRLHHSWTAFAVVALAASAATIAGVQWVRGAGKKLAQLTVVDAWSGESTAYATSYFGLKTSVFGKLDLWLPPEYPQTVEPELTNCFLRPLAPSTTALEQSTYADPSRYRLFASRSELQQVPIRGTLKQFEGRWSGSLPGPLRADLQFEAGPEPYEVRIAASSTLANQLGVDFHRCYLAYALRDVFAPGAAEADHQRAAYMYLFPLGELAKGGIMRPAAQCLADPATGGPLAFNAWKDARTVKDALEQCSRGFQTLSAGRRDEGWQGVPSEELALLMIALLGEYTPPPEEGALGVGGMFVQGFTADHCRHLDISHRIDRRTACFIGFSHEAGPVTLCTRSDGGEAYERVSPTEGEVLSMYRILIPLKTPLSSGGGGTP